MGLWQAYDLNWVYEQKPTTETLLLRKQRAKAVPTLIHSSLASLAQNSSQTILDSE